MPQPLRVLIVEDDPDDAELVLRELRRAGFEPEWHRVQTEQEYVDRLHPDVDIILSDYRLPGFGGQRALELLNEHGLSIPFIIISGTIGEDVAVEVMKLGAGDYLLKDRLGRLGLAVNQVLDQGRLHRERSQTQEELRRTHEQLQRLLEHSPAVIYSMQLERDRVGPLLVSDNITRLLDYSVQEASHFDWWAIQLHPEDRQRAFASLRETVELGGLTCEYRIRHKNGTYVCVEDNRRLVSDAEGHPMEIAGVWTDVTKRKQADDRLREQASLLDKARDAILVRDFDHRITYWNKSAERLYGWTAEEVMGRNSLELLQHDPRLFEKASEAVIKFGEWTGELLHTNKAGGQILIEARWTVVHDAEGQPKGILAINTDITERKKLEQQFLRAQRLESIGTLAGGIAHDLNNMLSPIMMSIDLLKLNCRDQRTQAILTTIETSARRGADMVQQILSFARGVEGQRVTIAPQEIIRDIQHLVQDTFPKNILFSADVPADLPAFLGDHTQVHQILLNLCVNARDAMPGGGMLSILAGSITVDENYAAMTPDAKPGEYVMIKVADTGTGIPREVVDKIFDPFFTTKEQGKGTGLGLSTVLAIVKSHGGFVNVQSEPDQGTTFTVCLPSNISSADLASAAQEEMHPRGKGELILIVDDEAAVRTITQQTLEAFGYRVMVAADGAAAVALYAQHLHAVSAVLTDMMMPVMDGPATIQVLIRLNPTVKIIAASGLNADGGVAKAAGMGVKYFLPKPYTAQTILTTLNKVLNDGA